MSVAAPGPLDVCDVAKSRRPLDPNPGSLSIEKLDPVPLWAVAHPDAPRCRTGTAIAGIAAIPFVSVTMVSVMVEVASTTDPSAGFRGLGALGAGVMMGLFVLRMIGAVRAGLSIARVAVERLLDHGIVGLVIPVWFVVIPVGDQRPPMAFVPSEIGPRGPPARIS